MRGAQRTGLVFGGDGDRDVAFRRALGDRADVDPRPRQCAEQLRGDAGGASHAVADRGQHADPGHDLHALYLRGGELAGEFVQQHGARGVGVGFAHHRADRMLGAALRDHHHRDPRRMQGGEHALGGAGHADQAGAFQADQGKPAVEGEPFHRAARAAVGIDAGAGEGGVEGIAH